MATNAARDRYEKSEKGRERKRLWSLNKTPEQLERQRASKRAYAVRKRLEAKAKLASS